MNKEKLITAGTVAAVVGFLAMAAILLPLVFAPSGPPSEDGRSCKGTVMNDPNCFY